jgi:hypothetical protein
MAMACSLDVGPCDKLSRPGAGSRCGAAIRETWNDNRKALPFKDLHGNRGFRAAALPLTAGPRLWITAPPGEPGDRLRPALHDELVHKSDRSSHASGRRGRERLAAELPPSSSTPGSARCPTRGAPATRTARPWWRCACPTASSCDWIRTQYAARIEALLAEAAGRAGTAGAQRRARESPGTRRQAPGRRRGFSRPAGAATARCAGSAALTASSEAPARPPAPAACTARVRPAAAAPSSAAQAQHRAHLRQPRARPRQPDGAHRRAARGRRRRGSCTTRCSSTAAWAWARRT